MSLGCVLKIKLMLGSLDEIMKAHYLCLKSRKLGKWFCKWFNSDPQCSTADMIWELRCRNYWAVRYLSQNKCQNNYIPSVYLLTYLLWKMWKIFCISLEENKLNMKGCEIHYSEITPFKVKTQSCWMVNKVKQTSSHPGLESFSSRIVKTERKTKII